MRIAIRDGESYYFARVTLRWAQQHDNGALISCGLEVGRDLSRPAFRWLQARKLLEPISHETWNHSGCQSSCVLRGNPSCRW